MAHHRCSWCKQEASTRHKRYGYLVCDECLARRAFRASVRRWWARMWSTLALWVDRALGRTIEQKKERMREERARQYAMHKAMLNTARTVPVNPTTILPQKR